ncbi:polyprotein [Grapevine Tunisian ringspot virus]|uniref:polyprotein n=1 Tax=Grapevine Tunisian ringspot virus TaxID=2052649 RepID=UPI00248202DB|nr:polyprotein [Grapevine Tunisian ringspot virus]QWS70118.1 polyprotein [Grapevine Tunisian ringspot virus]
MKARSKGLKILAAYRRHQAAATPAKVEEVTKTSTPSFPMGWRDTEGLSSPPCSPLSKNFCSSTFGGCPEGQMISLPSIPFGWRIPSYKQRFAALDLKKPARLLKGGFFIFLSTAFRVSAAVIKGITSMADSFLDAMDCTDTLWLEFVTPQATSCVNKACVSIIPSSNPSGLGWYGKYWGSFEDHNERPFSYYMARRSDKEGCDCKDCIFSWDNMISPVQRTGSLRAVFNDFPVVSANYRKGIMYPKAVSSAADEEGCTCDECLSAFAWMSPVQRTGSLKAVFNDFPVVSANYRKGILYPKAVSSVVDEEGCTCDECLSAFAWMSPVQRTGSLKAVFNDFPVVSANYRKGILYPKAVSSVVDEEGCTCNECLSAFAWMSPVQRTGSLKAVFNDFPVVAANYCKGVLYPKVVRPIADEEGCDCDDCTDQFEECVEDLEEESWLDYVSPVQRTGRLIAVYNDYPVLRAEYRYQGRFILPLAPIPVPERCSCYNCYMVSLTDWVLPKFKSPIGDKRIGNPDWEKQPSGRMVCINKNCRIALNPVTGRREPFQEDKRTGKKYFFDPLYVVWELPPTKEELKEIQRLNIIKREAILVEQRKEVQRLQLERAPLDRQREEDLRICLERARWNNSSTYSSMVPETLSNEHLAQGVSQTYSSMGAEKPSDQEAYENAEIAREVIERNYNLLTPETLIATAFGKEQRGFKVGEGKILEKATLKAQDVLYIESFLDKAKRGLGIDHFKPESRYTFGETTNFEVVRHPGNKDNTGNLSHQVFSRLPMMHKKQARKLLEKGVVTSERTAFDIGFLSYMPMGKPFMCLVSVMDGRFADSGEALLCSSYINLGQKKARMMVAPLVNFPLTQESLDDFLDNLYLTFIFYNINSIRKNQEILSYGVVEAAEHWERANWDVSRFVGDWDKILSGPTARGGRVLAGLNLAGVASAPLDEPIPELNQRLEIVARPPSVPEMGALYVSGQQEKASDFKRSYSIAGPSSRSSFSGFSQRFNPPVVKNWDETPGRFSTSQTYSGMVAEQNASSSREILSYQEVSIPKDTSAGKVLCDHQILPSMRSFGGKAYQSLLQYENFVADFDFEVSLNMSPFMGISIGVCFDFFNSINLTQLTDVPILAAQLLPNFVFSPGDPIKGTFSLERDVGHSWNARANAYGTGRILVYTMLNNHVPAAEAFKGVLKVFVNNIRPSPFLLRPTVSLPEFTTDETHSRIGIGRHFTLKQNPDTKVVAFSLDFAILYSVLTDKTVLCSSAAIQRLLMYQEGDLELEFQKLGISLVQAGFIVSIWPDARARGISDVLKVHHVSLPTGVGRVTLPLASPFGRVSTTEVTDTVQLYFDSTPNAPDTINGAYQGYVRFLGFRPREFIPRVVNAGTRFAWCQLSELKEDFTSFFLPARLCDLVHKSAKVIMWSNHLHWLVGTSGFFRGNITLHVTLAYSKKVTELDKLFQVQGIHGEIKVPTTWQVRSSSLFTCFQHDRASYPVTVGDYSGVTTSAPTGHRENFIHFFTNAAELISHIEVEVEVHNLSFYGRKLIIK